MLKIYLDTNIFSRLRQNEEKEYKLLNAVLNVIKEDLFMPFSKAHIDDLVNDKTEEKFLDVDFIERLTNNQYFAHNFLTHKTGHSQRRPIDILNIELQSPAVDPFKDLTSMFSVSDEPDYQDIFSLLIKPLLEMQTYRLDVPVENIQAKDLEYISKYSLPVNIDLSINDLFKQFSQINERLADRDSFKGMRKYNLDVFSKFTNKDVTIEAINKTLINSPLKKNLSELIATHNHSGREQTLNEKMSSGFIILNMFGLDKEKNKKANFISLNNDAQHAYYASYCDVFLTKDEGLRLKSKALYENYGIKTHVLNVMEFLQQLIEDEKA